MRKIILTIIAAALIAASTAPMATAGEHHHAGKANRDAPSEHFRNSNAYVAPAVQPDWSRYTAACRRLPAFEYRNLRKQSPGTVRGFFC